MNKLFFRYFFILNLISLSICYNIKVYASKYEEDEQKTSKCFIQTLPSELIIYTFGKLDHKSLLKERETCRLFKMLVDKNYLLPNTDEELLKSIRDTHNSIPDQLKIPLLEDSEERLDYSKKLISLAEKYFNHHYVYYTPEERKNSIQNLDRYRMLMYLAYKLGNNEALQKVKKDISIKEDELNDFIIHLPHIQPNDDPLLKQKVYAFWWEQIAYLNPSVRLALAESYKGNNEDNKTIIDIEKAIYWENYKSPYDFPLKCFM